MSENETPKFQSDIMDQIKKWVLWFILLIVGGGVGGVATDSWHQSKKCKDKDCKNCPCKCDKCKCDPCKCDPCKCDQCPDGKCEPKDMDCPDGKCFPKK